MQENKRECFFGTQCNAKGLAFNRTFSGWLVGWCLAALSAQKGYSMPCEK